MVDDAEVLLVLSRRGGTAFVREIAYHAEISYSRARAACERLVVRKLVVPDGRPIAMYRLALTAPPKDSAVR
jgi:DNA-binding IclR family transcriptional regulator